MKNVYEIIYEKCKYTQITEINYNKKLFSR